MKRNILLNALTLSLMISLIPMPAHAGWFDSISNYFNQPTKNSLVATTAIAGTALLATFVCAWNWWKKSDKLQDKLHKEEVAHGGTKNQLADADIEISSTRKLNDKLNNELRKAKEDNVKQHLAYIKIDRRLFLLKEKEDLDKIEKLEEEIKTLKKNAQQRKPLPTEPTMNAWDVTDLNNLAH